MSHPQGDARLWMGELDPGMDDNYLSQLWASLGYMQVNSRVIRDRETGASQGYAFLEFPTLEHARAALNSYNGQPIPNAYGKLFRLNWSHTSAMSSMHGSGYDGASGASAAGGSDEFSVFVGDLAHEVDDATLFNTFAGRFPSCKSAKVVTEPGTELSKGYGFVRFWNSADGRRAIDEMQGVYLAGRPLRLAEATPRRSATTGMSGGAPPPAPDSDPNNTTIFVGGIDGTITEGELKAHFDPYGEVVSVRIPIGRGCGFVSFAYKAQAQAAIDHMHNSMVGNNRIRLAWGKQSSNRVQQSTGIVGHSHHSHSLPTGPAVHAGSATATQSSSYWSNYAQDPSGGARYPYGAAPAAAAAAAPVAPAADYWAQYYAAAGYGAYPPVAGAAGAVGAPAAAAAAQPPAPMAYDDFEMRDFTKPYDVEAANETFCDRRAMLISPLMESRGLDDLEFTDGPQR